MALQGVTKGDVVNALLPHFQNDHTRHILLLDCGFGATDAIKYHCPKQLHYVGVMEQCAVGLAAGMAEAGLRPFIYSIAQFITHRALDQLYLNIVQDDKEVKLIGVGKDKRFRQLGASHTVEKRDIALCEAIGLRWLDPTPETLHQDIQYFVDTQSPVYLRCL